jgi:hypothetical protein
MVSIVRKAHSEDHNELYTQYKFSDSQSQTEKGAGDKYRSIPNIKQAQSGRDSPTRRDFMKSEPRTNSLGRRDLDVGDFSRFNTPTINRGFVHSHSFGSEHKEGLLLKE